MSNRIFKFRAWNEQKSEMVTDFRNTDYPEVKLNEHGLLIKSTWFTLMQFTGLVDKNGVEIYEGDIVKLHNNIPITKEEYWFPIYMVEYDIDGFRLEYAKSGGKSIDGIAFYFKYYSHKEIEVIGNIHQTPELLSV